MRLRVPFVLAVLLLLALPAAMVVYVGTIGTEAEPSAPNRPPTAETSLGGDSPAPSSRPCRPASPQRATARSEPRRPEHSGGGRSAPGLTEHFPPAPPSDPRFSSSATGRVLGSSGGPLAGVEVLGVRPWISRIDSAGRGGRPSGSRYLLVARASTDTAGRFELRGLDANERKLIVLHHPDHVTVARYLPQNCYPGPARMGDYRLESGVTVTGVCRDAEGRPLAGVTVTGQEFEACRHFQTERVGLAPSTVSAADGRFRLDRVPSGDLRIVGRHSDGRSVSRLLGRVASGCRAGGIDLCLREGLKLAGCVVDPQGRGIAGAHVQASLFEDLDGGSSVHSVMRAADGDGRFALVDVTNGRWRVKATLHGFRTDGIDAAAGTTDIRLMLEPARVFTVRGIVVARGTGEPIEGARVGIGSPFRSSEWAAGRDGAVSVADGTFCFEVPEKGHLCTVWATAEGFVWRGGTSLDLGEEAAEPPPLRVELQPTGRISGRVVRSGGGGPVAGALVYLDKASKRGVRSHPTPLSRLAGASLSLMRASTDEDGVFVIDEIAPGTYLLAAQAVGLAPATPRRVEIVASEECRDQDLVLGFGGALHGTVCFPDGTPAVGYIVTLNEGKVSRTRSPVDEAGRFSFDHISPGRFKLDLQQVVRIHGGSWSKSGTRGGWYPRRLGLGEVTIVEGGRVERHVTLERGVRLFGLVRSGGVFRARCFVHFESLEPARCGPGGTVAFARARRATTNELGAYAIADAPPGRGRISVRVREGSGSVLALEREMVVPRRPAWPIDLDLPGGGVRGRVVWPLGAGGGEGRPQVNITSKADPRLKRGCRVGIDGSFAFETLPPGAYMVRVLAGESWQAVEYEVQVRPDVVTRGVTIRLGPAAR